MVVVEVVVVVFVVEVEVEVEVEVVVFSLHVLSRVTSMAVGSKSYGGLKGKGRGREGQI